ASPPRSSASTAAPSPRPPSSAAPTPSAPSAPPAAASAPAPHACSPEGDKTQPHDRTTARPPTARVHPLRACSPQGYKRQLGRHEGVRREGRDAGGATRGVRRLRGGGRWV